MGRPRATSPAKLGPDSTAGAAAATVSASTSVISFSEPCSIALGAQHHRQAGAGVQGEIAAARRADAAPATTARMKSRSGQIRRGRRWRGRRRRAATPGRNSRFSCVGVDRARPPRPRAPRAAAPGPARAATWASAVPQAPPPSTPTVAVTPWRPLRPGTWVGLASAAASSSGQRGRADGVQAVDHARRQPLGAGQRDHRGVVGAVCSGGAANEKPLAVASASSRARTARFAATPPATTKRRCCAACCAA